MGRLRELFFFAVIVAVSVGAQTGPADPNGATPVSPGLEHSTRVSKTQNGISVEYSPGQEAYADAVLARALIPSNPFVRLMSDS